jgi:leucyl-tRNA synthetase
VGVPSHSRIYRKSYITNSMCATVCHAGMSTDKAMKAITEALEKNGVGTSSEKFRIRDWLVSRQRYWGCPIPIVCVYVCLYAA